VRAGLEVDGRLDFVVPGESVAVAGAMAQVDVHIDEALFGDEAGTKPGGGREFVPQAVAVLGISGDVLCSGVGRFGDGVKQLFQGSASSRQDAKWDASKTSLWRLEGGLPNYFTINGRAFDRRDSY
jgi:hypothetical protein